MTETTEQTPATPTIPPPLPPIAKATKVNLVKCTLESDEWKGFSYYRPEYLDLQEVIDILGAQAILACVNQNIGARISQVVKNKLPKNLSTALLSIEKQRVLKEQNGVLFSANEALEWRPTIKGETSKGILKLIQKALLEGQPIDELNTRLMTALTRESRKSFNLDNIKGAVAEVVEEEEKD